MTKDLNQPIWQQKLKVGMDVEVTVFADSRVISGEVTEVHRKWLAVDTWMWKEDGRERRFWWREIKSVKVLGGGE